MATNRLRHPLASLCLLPNFYKLAGFKNFIGFAIYIHKNKS